MRKHLRARQHGQAIGLAAVAMVGMVGMAAFVIDAGFLWETHRELQKTADVAALAGISKMPTFPPDGVYAAGDCSVASNSSCDADDMATKYVDSNLGVTSRLCGSPTRTIMPGTLALHEDASNRTTITGVVYTLTVTLECTAGYSFGRILGLTSAQVRASATAAIGTRKFAGCLSPLGVVDQNGALSEPPSNVPLGNTSVQWQDYARNGYTSSDPFAGPNSGFGVYIALFSDADVGGNWQALDLDNVVGNTDSLPDAAKKDGFQTEFEAYLSGKYCAPDSLRLGEFVLTDPGVSVGPFRQALRARGLRDCPDPACTLHGAHDSYKLACPDPFSKVVRDDGTTWNGVNSVCLTDIVFVDKYDDPGRSDDSVRVVGFGLFFIEGEMGNGSREELWGYFVKVDQPGDITGFADSSTLAIRLIR